MIKAIAIIESTSAMGPAVAESLSGNNQYRLLLMSHDQVKLAALRSRLQHGAAEVFGVSCVREASWEADIIIIVAPYGHDVAEKISEVATGKIVIVIFSSEAMADSHGDMMKNSGGTGLRKLLPHSKVVVIFPTLDAGDFAAAVFSGRSVEAFVDGINSDLAGTVSAVMTAAGFRLVGEREPTG